MKPLEMIKNSAIQNADAYGPGAGKWCFICYQHIAGPSLGLSEYGKFSAIILLQMFILSMQQASITGIFPGYVLVLIKGRDPLLKQA